MQKKLRELYAPSDMLRMQQQTGNRAQGMGLPGMSQPTQQDFNRASSQAKREMDASLREQISGQDKLLKLISAREKALKDLKRQQDSMTKGSEDELKTKEKIARVEENLARQRDTYRQKDQALNQAMDAKQSSQMSMQRLATAYENGGIGGAAKAGGRMVQQGLGNMSPGAMVSGGLSAAGVGLGVFSNYYREYGRMPIDSNLSMANATQGSIGRDVSNVFGRRTAFEMPFMGERARASKRALEAMRTGQNSDMMDIGANMLGGAGAGAAVGSIIPGLGTAVGAGVGAIGGGIKSLMNENQRSLIMSKLPFIGGAYKEKYQSKQAENLVNDYNTGYESEKNSNPFKKAAVGDYEQNFMRNLDAQRMMGMGNDQFYGKGGYMSSATSAGFTPEIALQMSQGIIGAGGSTRSAAGNSVFGAQMQRGMGMTNASSILGSLSGSMGSSDATRASTIKILAEGMRLGLDDSKFAEENRRFTQSAAEIIARTGTSNSDDAGRIAGKFGSFVAENTNAGINAAKGAYEEYQQMSSSTTGARGVMRAAGFMSDSKLAKMSTMDKQALMQMPEGDITTDNTYVQGMAQKYNMKPQEIVDAVTGVNKGSQNRYKEADVLRDRIKSSMKTSGVTQVTKDNFGSLSKETQADLGSLQSYNMNEYGYSSSQQAQARTFGMVNGTLTPTGTTKKQEEVINGKLTGDTGKVEDKTIAAQAGDSATILKNFNELRPSLAKAAESAALFTDKIREMNAALLGALEDARNGKGDKRYDQIKKLMEENASMGTQTQATRKSQ